MDNQGSNNFNNNQGSVAHDANFWNPNPGTQSQGFQSQSADFQGFQSQSSQSQEALQSQTSPYQTSPYQTPQSQTFQPQNFQAQNFQTRAQSNSFQTTSNNFQSSASVNTNNLLNKDFNMMTDEEKKEAERIARAKNRVDLLKTIGLIVISLLAVLFIGLFIWMTLKWSEASTNVQGKIDVAVAEAKNQLQAKLENEFAEKEQYPFLTFSGPADFGSLTFEYPKNWSVYIPDDASRGGEFNAYLNPGQVNVVSDTTIMALRVSIRTEQIDSVLEDYNRKVQDGEMTVASKVVNKVNVNVFTGKLDNDYQGIVCIFKIRDKTAILRTDSSNVFRENFEKILSTIRFNS